MLLDVTSEGGGERGGCACAFVVEEGGRGADVERYEGELGAGGGGLGGRGERVRIDDGGLGGMRRRGGEMETLFEDVGTLADEELVFRAFGVGEDVVRLDHGGDAGADCAVGARVRGVSRGRGKDAVGVARSAIVSRCLCL